MFGDIIGITGILITILNIRKLYTYSFDKSTFKQSLIFKTCGFHSKFLVISPSTHISCNDKILVLNNITNIVEETSFHSAFTSNENTKQRSKLNHAIKKA